jgi:hypothetical protein
MFRKWDLLPSSGVEVKDRYPLVGEDVTHWTTCVTVVTIRSIPTETVTSVFTVVRTSHLALGKFRHHEI